RCVREKHPKYKQFLLELAKAQAELEDAALSYTTWKKLIESTSTEENITEYVKVYHDTLFKLEEPAQMPFYGDWQSELKVRDHRVSHRLPELDNFYEFVFSCADRIDAVIMRSIVSDYLVRCAALGSTAPLFTSTRSLT